MRLLNNKGMSLVEALISIALISALLVSILGAFVISRLGVDRAKHRMMAMNTIRQYMEIEINANYAGGGGAGTYYCFITSDNPITFTIDDMGTSSTSDDLTGTITPEPYPGEPCEAANLYPYKKIGFVVTWQEKLFGGAALPMCEERAVAYVAHHD